MDLLVFLANLQGKKQGKSGVMGGRGTPEKLW